MWFVLPMRPQARVLGLMSVMPRLLCAVYKQLDLPELAAEQLLACQAAWVALPSVHHGKNQSYRANQGQRSSFLPHLSAPPPPLNYRWTVHSQLCWTQSTWHPRGNMYSNGRCRIFFDVILFGSCPPRHYSWYRHNGSPFTSLLLRAQVLVHAWVYLPAKVPYMKSQSFIVSNLCWKF